MLLPAADELPLVGRVFMEFPIMPLVTVPFSPDIEALFPAADVLPDFERLSFELPIAPLLGVDPWPGVSLDATPLFVWPLIVPGEFCMVVCAIAPLAQIIENAVAAAIILVCI